MDLLWACELENLRAYCDRVLLATEETKNAAAIFFQSREDKRQILTVDGDTAVIDIRGTLTNRPSFIASFLGFNTTSYNDIQAAIETIAADDTIKRVRLVVDSPGGNVTGLDETWIALRALAKDREVIAENHGMMASGAYWLATAADKIAATSPAAETGSIGVYFLAVDYTEMDKKQGVREIRIVSKNAPLKNPDPATKEGLKAWQDRLDAIERVFISRVAEGRGVTEAKVKKDFGQGAILVAQDPEAGRPDALSVGMIDEVVGAVSAGKGTDKKKTEADPDSDIAAGSPPFKDYPIVDKPWDATAAIKRVRTKTGSTEKPSASYKNAFFWYDPENADTFGGYKLPFVDVVDGAFKAVRRGVFAAKGAMAGARGQKPAIPAKDVAGVNSHIDRYVKKIEKEDKEKKGASTPTPNTEGKSMKYKDLEAADPELKAEVDAMIATAEKTAGEKAGTMARGLIDLAMPVLTGDSPQFLKDLAGKLIKGDVTEAEFQAARGAYDAMTEDQKAKAAVKDSVEPGPTPAEPPKASESNGEIKSEEDHQNEVARYRAAHGMEAN